MNADKDLRELWPDPPMNRPERIRHFLDVFADLPDDYMILMSTAGVYGRTVRTGVLMGDLRELHNLDRLSTETVLGGGSAGTRLVDRVRGDAGQHGPPGNGGN